MNITAEITSTNIEAGQFIQSNTHGDYHFIPALITASINIDGISQDITFQTGHSYDYQDYSMPSNALSVYDDGSYDLFYEIDSHYDELEDQGAIDSINEGCETAFNAEEMQAIYEAITELSGDAQLLISEAEREAEEAMEKDNHIYVLVTTNERIELDDDVFEVRECEEREIKVFNSDEDADTFIESINVTDSFARVIDKEEATASCYRISGS